MLVLGFSLVDELFVGILVVGEHSNLRVCCLGIW